MIHEPIWYVALDSVTLIRYITGTLKNCESGRTAGAGASIVRPLMYLTGGIAMSGRVIGTDRILAAEKIVGRRNGGLQRRKPKAGDFTPDQRHAFLDALASTCNVRKAAQHVGVAPSTAYSHRINDPAFAELWREAMSVGYDRLEMLVLEHCGAGEAIAWPGPARAGSEAADDAPPPFDFDRAIRALQRYQAARDGGRSGRSGRPLTNATREETNAALVKALTAAAKRMAASDPDNG